MDRKRSRKTRFKIPVPSKPRPYRPGDGPPLAPLTLAPENDLNAFIADKRVLPGTTTNGEPKLRMYYVVGWPDLPAARVAILATEVYDYVSQRTVEDFEYKASLERDEEEQRREAEKRRRAKVAAAKKAKSANATNTPTTPGTPTTSGQKRRGRPRKAMLQTRQLALQDILGSPADIEVPLPSAGTSGPSLSTPQKKRTGELATDMEEDEADADNAIFKQLCADVSDVDDMDVDDNEEGDKLPSDGIPDTMSSSAEIGAYAQKLWLNKDSTLFKRANGKLALKSSTSYIPVPEVLRSNKQFPFPPKPSPTKAIGDRQSTTPIPVPPPFQSGIQIPLSGPFGGKHSNIFIPPPPLGSSQEIPRPKSFDGKYSTTPIPVPSWPYSTNGTHEPSASAPPAYRTTPRPHLGFTPAARSSGKWPSASSSQSPGNAAAAEGVWTPLSKQQNLKEREGSSRPKKKPKHQHAPKEAEDGQQVWVVDRLEGDRVVETENGGRERYFKVRWEGEWPPDQNPTWEPEENIAPHLVKRYLKRKKKLARDHESSPAKIGGTPTKPPSKALLKRKYSSVMEAFEGDDELIHNLGEDAMNEEESDGQEEILVVATTSKKIPKHRPEELEAKFLRDLAAAIHSTHDKGGQS
ncbi:hypothetical protein F4820DRAFT_436332 [Hypoxylon rubiginosum]|uniref:Uncharacterized protein n=1 Tax=Hypoxylon rubiginosum TaxID=110542 RepID=A0ACB9YN12_9PEZI|nr:hypothetical protein F4820DRAFT_436332 [Hypoxylon rubiginosum]